MPLVDIVVGGRGRELTSEAASGFEGLVLSDPDGRARSHFGALPAAVLLGTDGLLAGGPAVGVGPIGDLLGELAHQFTDAFGDTMRPPLPISCKCITYGRVELLEEALESFLRQDYDGDHELVIVNDYPRQRLHFDHPRVRIYNLDFTFDTIGEKENFAVSACRHDTIAVWDDDDIALPHHLRNIDRYFAGHDLLHWERGAAFVGGRIEALAGLGNSGIVYRKSLWRDAGGHPFENAGYDVSLVVRLRDHGARVALAAPEPRDVSWFYAWGNGSYHMSGQGRDTSDRPNVVQRHSEHIEGLRRAGLIPTGDVELRPHWNQDYPAVLEEYCQRHHP